MESNIKQITIRLKTGDDLRGGIDSALKKHGVKAGCLVSIVGSLSHGKLRMPGAKIVRDWTEELEIVSGTGTLSINGSHIHIAVSDINGKVIGGHLVNGSIVRTTAEIVILNFTDTEYSRVFDAGTGFAELEIIDEK